jgi:acetyltransferase-like isoleucine patch superfamily enzyme
MKNSREYQFGINTKIHETTIIHKNVTIGNNVIIHPFVVIEEGVTIGDRTEIFPGTHIGKKPKGAGATARDITFEAKVNIGSECAIGPNAIIYYDVEIGNNTLIGDGASIREQSSVGNHCILSRYVTLNYNASIGNHTKIMDQTHITGNCNIGNNVFISVLVSTVNDNIVVEGKYDENRIFGPTIEDNASIGAGAILLPAVRIGEGSFVGSGALVTKDVPPHVLVLGIPAKIIKKI